MSTAEYDAIAQWIARCKTCVDHGEVFMERTTEHGWIAHDLRPCPACGGGS